jgi:hypothetical protein
MSVRLRFFPVPIDPWRLADPATAFVAEIWPRISLVPCATCTTQLGPSALPAVNL